MPTNYARSFALVAAAVLLSGPDLAVAEDAGVDPAWPDWLKKAMSQEHKRIRYKQLSLGPFETVMPGKITDREEIDQGTYYAAADDGSGTSFECWFFDDTMDMATSTVNIAEAVIENTSTNHGPVGNRRIHHVDAGEIDGAPFLALEWLYTVGEAPNALVALTKVRAAERDGMFVICSHSLPGYRDSFAKSFDQLVSKLSRTSDAPGPYYREVIVHNLNGLNIGISQLSMTMDDEGDTKIESSDAMLVPVSATDLGSTDTSTVSWSTPEGYVINTVHASVENGDLVSQLSLQLNDDGAWQVDGTLSGKNLNQVLGSDAEPVSALGEMLTVKGMFGDTGATRQELDSWIPSADPTVFSTVVIEMDEASDVPGAGVVTLGPLRISGEFEATGSMVKGIMDFGISQLNFERVFASGAIH